MDEFRKLISAAETVVGRSESIRSLGPSAGDYRECRECGVLTPSWGGALGHEPSCSIRELERAAFEAGNAVLRDHHDRDLIANLAEVLGELLACTSNDDVEEERTAEAIRAAEKVLFRAKEYADANPSS